jgi:uncharacterized membrane protein
VSNAELESEQRAVDRLTIFSDAVVAIAITLLAIDLPVPAGDTVSEFLASARHNSGHYAAFLISFFAIAGAWSQHHDIFRYARRMDGRLRTINTEWLLMIVLIPFATKLLTTRGHQTLGAHALRFGFYALLQVLASGAVLGMLRHMLSRGQLAGIPAPVVASATWQTCGQLLGFALSIPVFFATTYAWVLWIVIPLLVFRLYRFRHRESEAS